MKQLFLLLCCGIVSCSDKPKTYFKDTTDTFSFEKKIDNIQLTSETMSYIIWGKLDEPKSDGAEYDLIVAPDYTTAVTEIHYKLPESMRIKFDKNKTAALEIKLLHENITEQLTLTFTTAYKMRDKDYTKYTDTLFVTLIPQFQ